MKIVTTPFPDAALIVLEQRGDERGSFLRIFDQEFFSTHKMPVHIDHTAESINPFAYTLRGLHFQKPPYAERKLIRCVKGKILTSRLIFGTDHRLRGALITSHYPRKMIMRCFYRKASPMDF